MTRARWAPRGGAVGRTAHRALLTVGALALLLVPACTAAPAPPPPPGLSSSPTPDPAPGGTSPAGGRSTTSPPPSGAKVPTGTSTVEADGLALTLPMGMVEVDRASQGVEQVVVYNNLGVRDGGGAFVRVTSTRGPFLPFDLTMKLLTDSSSAQIGSAPVQGPEPVDVPGADRAETVSYLWEAEDSGLPSRTSYALVEAGPDLHHLVKIGGEQASWTDERVEGLLDSLRVTDGAAA